ncbi:Oxoglutarate/iron-dependent dioxygenase [Cinnamomum micranthum f. kanehirae]|uniref:Oxoglutarate/iron-dependent dioxygenase n=1 Tax=Cinnamomum micranthum f. kanehirae TaxID=337451 RepID=A0A3S4NDN6_9MAGN|nr:Oxoglutarate/iron-dependent dioxygenase [Cinnamomum micranthum f. kanehirae]
MESREPLKDFTVGSLPTLFYIPNFISESEESQLLHQIYHAPKSKWKALKNRRLQNWGGVVHEKGLLPQDLPPWLTAVTQRISEQTGLFPSPINHVLINEYLPDQGIMPHQDGPAYFPVVAILSLGSSVAMNFTPHQRLRDYTNEEISAAKGSNSDEGGTEIDTNIFLKEVTSRQMDDHQPFSILLMPRSLLVFKDMAYSDYLHGIEDTNIHSLDKVVNVSEALNHREQDNPLSSEEKEKTEDIEKHRSIHRTSTRVSLTCRSVLKVHRNLFKF